MIHPIYLEPGAEAPVGAIDLAASTDPQRRQAHVSVVLRRLDVSQIVAAALVVLQRVAFTEAHGGAWRTRRNYEEHFLDDGDPVGPTSTRVLIAAKSTTMRAICEPGGAGRALSLEATIFAAACWLLWGDPEPGASWGVAQAARDIAAECGVDMRPQYMLDAVREMLEQTAPAA